MSQHCQIIELLAEHWNMLALFMLEDILYQHVVGIQHQSFGGAEHGRIHSVHIVHLHHILHSPALLGESHHGRNVRVFQFLYLYLQFIFAQGFAEQFSEGIGGFFQLFLGSLFLECVGDIRVNALKFQLFILTFYMGDESGINVVFQDNGIQTGFLEHIDVLALLNFIRYIVDGGL